MAIVDERGRLFGRWNLLDLAVLILLVGLMPLAYGAYLLFHDRPPTLVSVTPNRVEESQEFQLTIKGTNLRPYMRVSLGAQQARDFVFRSTEEAALPFAHVAPGTYDIVLYDSAQERFRLRDGLTVTASNLPSTEIIAIGAFGNLDAAGAAKLTPGTVVPNVGEIVSVGKAMPDRTDVFTGSRVVGVPLNGALRLPAVVKFNCLIKTPGGSPYCTVNDVTVVPKNVFQLATPLGTTPFQVQRVRSPEPLHAVKVTLRVTGLASLLAKIRAGDIDTGGLDGDVEVLARVEHVGAVRVLSAATSEVEVTLVTSLQRVDQGWLYDSLPLRVGSSVALRTSGYEVGGVVTDIAAPRE